MSGIKRILNNSIERVVMYTIRLLFYKKYASAIFINYLHKEMLVRMLSKTHIFYTSVINAVNKQIEFTKRYPVPAFVISGLFVGSFFHWPLYQSILGQWIWLITLIIGGTPIILDTFPGILRKKFASDIVAMMAIIAAILLNDALPGVVIVIMQSGGKALEDYAFRQASSSLDALLARSPRIAHRRKGDNIEEINVSDIQVGDLLVVRPGDLVPVDGKIIDGLSQNGPNK
jgi:cation transport ATPase